MAVRHVLVAVFLGVPSLALAQPALPSGLPAPSAPPAVLLVPSTTDPQAFRFAGTEWGATSAATRKQLEGHGFSFEQVDEDGDMIFSGTLNDRPALVVALFIQDRLSKILLSVPTDDETTLPIYREIRQVLSGQYGAPGVEVEDYSYPFAEGKHVGYEAAALRVGKANIGALWQTGGEALGIRISERLIVSAHYESQAWKQEAERRASRKTGD
jgi:hypothetical protein